MWFLDASIYEGFFPVSSSLWSCWSSQVSFNWRILYISMGWLCCVIIWILACTCCSFKIGLLVYVLPHCQDISTLSFFFSSRRLILGSLVGSWKIGNSLFVGHGDSKYRWMWVLHVLTLDMWKAGHVFIASSHGFAILFASVKISVDLGGNVSNLHGRLSSELSLLSASLHFLLLCSQRGDANNEWQWLSIFLVGPFAVVPGKIFGDIWMLFFE